MKAIIELADPLGSCSLIENKSKRSDRFEYKRGSIYDYDWRNLLINHDHPLYVTTSIREGLFL